MHALSHQCQHARRDCNGQHFCHKPNNATCHTTIDNQPAKVSSDDHCHNLNGAGEVGGRALHDFMSMYGVHYSTTERFAWVDHKNFESPTLHNLTASFMAICMYFH